MRPALFPREEPDGNETVASLAFHLLNEENAGPAGARACGDVVFIAETDGGELEGSEIVRSSLHFPAAVSAMNVENSTKLLSNASA
jgi:hypothetical protein